MRRIRNKCVNTGVRREVTQAVLHATEAFPFFLHYSGKERVKSAKQKQDTLSKK